MTGALSIPEVARELGVSRAHAYRLLYTERLPYIRLSPRRLVVRRADLEAWLESRVVREGVEKQGTSK